MRMPWQWIGPGLSHLTGASTGRESAAIHLTKSLSEQIWKLIRRPQEFHAPLILTAIAAGFSGALGAPIAGVLFSLETSKKSDIQYFSADLVQLGIASLIAHLLGSQIGVGHWPFPTLPTDYIHPDNFSLFSRQILGCIVLGLFAGPLSAIFTRSIQLIRKFMRDILPNPAIAGLAGGIFLLILFQFAFTTPFQGLGLETIKSSFFQVSDGISPIGKLAITALSIGFGFMGGEFIPLVFIGTGVGSALSPILGIAPGFMASLGFLSLYAGSTQAPLACIALAYEIFNWQIALFAVIACFLSAKIHQSLMRSQMDSIHSKD